jgi:hypothetical protein
MTTTKNGVTVWSNNVLKKIWDLESAADGETDYEASTLRHVPSIGDFLNDPHVEEAATTHTSTSASRVVEAPPRSLPLLQDFKSGPTTLSASEVLFSRGAHLTTSAARPMPSISHFLDSVHLPSTSGEQTQDDTPHRGSSLTLCNRATTKEERFEENLTLSSRSEEDQQLNSRSGVNEPLNSRSGINQSLNSRSGENRPLNSRSGIDQSLNSRSRIKQPFDSRSGIDQPFNSRSGVKRPVNSNSEVDQPLSSNANKMAAILSLPLELLALILDWVSDDGLLTCRLVCRTLNAVATDKLRGHKVSISKRSNVTNHDLDMIGLIQPIILEMCHVTGHVTMECVRKFIQSCSKSVKVLKYINCHFLSPLGSRVPLLFTLSFHWRGVVNLEVMLLQTAFSQDVITSCLQQFTCLQRISMNGSPKSCRTALRTLAIHNRSLRYLSIPAHSLITTSTVGGSCGLEVIRPFRDTLEELEIKSIPKPNLVRVPM